MSEKSLPVADRYKLRQFVKNIGGNFDTALVELLKNSDDSLKRIESKRKLEDYEKVIKIICKRRNELIVVDNAEGMNGERLSKIIRYGEDTSERQKVEVIAGLFGIGLKDAIYGLGVGRIQKIKSRIECGSVISAKNGIWNIIKFFVDYVNGSERVRYITPQNYTPSKDELDLITNGHGTIVKIFPNKLTYPTHDNLKKSLEYHIRLRDMLSNKNRIIHLVDENKNKTEKLIWIQTWYSEECLFNDDIKLDKFPQAKVHLEIHRASRDLKVLSLMRAERGILIKGIGDIHEITLFDFNSNTYAKKLYGELKTDYIDILLRQREEILEQSRTGLNHHHEFYIDLKKCVNEILEKIILEEKERTRGETKINNKTKKELKTLAVVLRQIGAEELSEDEALIGPEPITIRSKIPDFGFIKRYRKIYVLVESEIIFYAKYPEILKLGDLVEFSIDNPEIEISHLGFTVSSENIKNNIIQFTITTMGLKAGTEGDLISKFGDLESSIRISVIDKPSLKEFNFARDHYKVIIESTKNITFTAKIDDVVELGDPLNFYSNNSVLTVLTPKKIIEDNRNGFFVTSITISIGKNAEIQEKYKIKAFCSGKENSTEIEVIEEPPKISFPEPAIDDKKEDPEYPVELSIRENKIWVFALHKTVKPFWDPEKQTDDIRFRIRFVDLIVEETINFIVGRKLENVESSDWFTSTSLKRSIYKNQAHKIYRALGLMK